MDGGEGCARVRLEASAEQILEVVACLGLSARRVRPRKEVMRCLREREVRGYSNESGLGGDTVTTAAERWRDFSSGRSVEGDAEKQTGCTVKRRAGRRTEPHQGSRARSPR